MTKKRILKDQFFRFRINSHTKEKLMDYYGQGNLSRKFNDFAERLAMEIPDE